MDKNNWKCIYIINLLCITNQEPFNDYYYHVQRQQLIYRNTFLNYGMLSRCFQD